MNEMPLDDARPFTRRHLKLVGGDPTVLRRRDFVRVINGVWIRRGATDDDVLIRAALALHPPGAVASHVSAAKVHRLPLPAQAFVHVTVTDPEDRRYRTRIKSHVTSKPLDVVVVRGIPTTDLVPTFIACAGLLSLVDLIALGDALVRRGVLTAAQLRAACRTSTSYYANRAREAAEYVRDGVDSPMETRLRLLIVLAGLPEPQVDVRLYHRDGSWRRRFDLCWPRVKLVVEYDGRHHAEDSRQWHSDIDRREELDDEGYRVLVVTAKGIFVEPERTLLRVRQQLVLRGWGHVPQIQDEWRTHFAA